MGNEMRDWYGEASKNKRDFVAAAREAVITAYTQGYFAQAGKEQDRIPRLPKYWYSPVDRAIAFLSENCIEVTGFSVEGADIRIMINDGSLGNPGLEFLIRKAETGSHGPPELILKMRDLFYE